MSIKNNLYNIFGGAGRAVIFLFTIPLMVNYMGVEKFGVWALITSVGHFALLLDVGIASTTMHFVSRINSYKNSSRRIEEINNTVPILFGINTFFAAVISFIFIFFTESVATFFLSKNLINDSVLWAIKGMGLYSSTLLTQHFFSGIIQANNQFLLVNIIKFFYILTTNVGLLVLSYLKIDFYILSFYMFSVSLIILIVYVYLAFKQINFLSIRPVFGVKKIKEVFVYCGATWLGYLGGVLFTQLDKIIVGKVSNEQVVGVYAAIISITSYISSIATVGLQPIIPKLTQLWVEIREKKKEFVREYKLAYQFNTFIIIFMSIVLMVTFKPLLTQVMNIDINIYPQALLGFQLAIIIYALNSLSVPGFYTLMAIKKTKYLGKWQITGALIALIGIYFLGNKYGLYGVILGNLGLIITVIFNNITSKVITESSFKWIKFIYKPLLIFLIVIVCKFILNNVYFDILISAISLVALTVWFLNEHKEIYSKIKKIIIK